jgi:voltage-gated potassium channel
MYSTLVIAIVTGVVVNFYTEITELSKKETLTAFMDKLERLDTLNKDELKEISDGVKRFKNDIK